MLLRVGFFEHSQLCDIYNIYAIKLFNGIVTSQGSALTPVPNEISKLHDPFHNLSRTVDRKYQKFVAEEEKREKAEAIRAEKNRLKELRSRAIDAKTLWREYQNNEVRADNQFKGKTFLVDGVVSSVDKDFLDNAFVSLRSPNQFMSTRAEFVDKELSRLANLSKGDRILIKCTCTGMLIGSPMLKNCTFL